MHNNHYTFGVQGIPSSLYKKIYFDSGESFEKFNPTSFKEKKNFDDLIIREINLNINSRMISERKSELVFLAG